MSDIIMNSNQYESLWDGTTITLQVLLWSFIIGLVLSLVIGVARLSAHRWVRGLAFVYVELFRGVSSFVLLFWMAFALPILLGFDQPSLLMMGSIALGLNMGGYGAEIVRGAIQSVPSGQHEATVALNMSASQRIRHVVLPQAMPVILPPMGNLTIEILKGTALVSGVGLADLTFEANTIRANRLVADEPVSTTWLFVNVLIFYFVMAQIINLGFRLWERRINSRYRQREGRGAIDVALAAPAAGVTG